MKGLFFRERLFICELIFSKEEIIFVFLYLFLSENLSNKLSEIFEVNWVM